MSLGCGSGWGSARSAGKRCCDHKHTILHGIHCPMLPYTMTHRLCLSLRTLLKPGMKAPAEVAPDNKGLHGGKPFVLCLGRSKKR